MKSAVANAMSGARWERLADDGPHVTLCNRRIRISKNYFLGHHSNLEEEERLMYTEQGKQFMVHNGE